MRSRSASQRNTANVASTTGKPTISSPSESDSVTPVTQTVNATIEVAKPVSRYSASAPMRRSRAAEVGAGADAVAVAAMAFSVPCPPRREPAGFLPSCGEAYPRST